MCGRAARSKGHQAASSLRLRGITISIVILPLQREMIFNKDVVFLNTLTQ
jgi:hypothetical protein